MKRVYFIRHGETLMNRKRIHQGPEEPLTAKGEKQASEVALLLKKKGIDTLLSSTFVRARQTAEIISKELDLPVVPTEHVVEFHRPHALYGTNHYSVPSLWYAIQLFFHRENPRWDNDGAENMFSIRNRILDTKKQIEALPGTHIAVVSHSIFMHMFTQAVCADRSLKLQEFIGGILGRKKIPNTGIIAFEIDDSAPEGTCSWWLVNEETNQEYLKQR